MLSLKTHRVTPLIVSHTEKSDPGFSPDGNAIVYSEGTGQAEGKRIHIRSLDGKRVRQLTSESNVYDIEPSFSHDDKQVCSSRAARRRPYSMGGWTWDQYDLWVINIDGTNLHRITDQKYYQMLHPLFLTANKQFIYEVFEGDNCVLYSVNGKNGNKPVPFGGGPKSDIGIGSWAGDAHLSRSGSRIAFISDLSSPFKYDIWLMNTDQTNLHSLGINTFSDYNKYPVFLPSDEGPLFLAGTESGAGNRPIFSLWHVDLNDKKAHQIAGSRLFSDPAHWKHNTAGYRN